MKTTSTYYKLFTTSNPTTGALLDATGDPVAKLYRNGTDVSATMGLTVTPVTTGIYKIASANTFTSYGYGNDDKFDCVVTATVGGIAAGVVVDSFSLSDIQPEVDAALVANNLDHLCKTATASANMTTEVADNSILSRIISGGTTANFVPSTDALTPIRDEVYSRTLPAEDYVVVGDTIAAVTTVTSLINAPTNGDLTQAMKTSVETACGTANTSYGANKTAPPTASDIRTAIGLATANLDTQLAGLPTDSDVAAACLASNIAYGANTVVPDNTKTGFKLASDGLNDVTSFGAATAFGLMDFAVNTINGRILATYTPTEKTAIGLLSNVDGGIADIYTTANAIKVQTDKLQFSTDNDIKATLGSETVALSLDQAVNVTKIAGHTVDTSLAQVGVNVVSGVSTPPTVTQIRQELEGSSYYLKAIKDKTDNLPAIPASQGDVTALNNLSKADVDEAITDNVTIDSINSDVVDIKAVTTKLDDMITDEESYGNMFTSEAMMNCPLSGSVLGNGQIPTHYYVYQNQSSRTLPISGVKVQVSTDIAGANIIALGTTNALGKASFLLNAGTYYMWCSKDGYSFVNPDTEVVA